jgi:aspartyl-tRNA(Asn)/glutamyl-tRNA(Gln) amidotransferase subunit A
MSDPIRLTLSAAAEQIRLGKLTAVELTRSALQRIEQIDPRVLAWARLAPDAMQQAERLDALLQRGHYFGPLHGVPLGVKDIFCTAGLETSAGSPILKGFIPGTDAEAVKRLRGAGAVILGKTATTEFACYDPAPTRNPHDLEHSPGGSSAGSAAAVAAFMCFGALGTQTAGSILRPAAYCGVTGLKPTYDLVSRQGVIPLAWSLDHVGPISRTAADAALLFDAIRRPGSREEPEVSLQGRSIGIPDRYFFEGADAQVLADFEQAIPLFERVGLRVQQVRLPELFEVGAQAGNLILRVEAAAFHQHWFLSRADGYSPKLRALIEAGLKIPGVSYLRAQQVRRAAAGQMRELFERIDFLATPAAPTPAPRGLASTGDPKFNLPFTTFGVPALAVPTGRASSGLPLGLQLVTRYFGEKMLLRLGSAIEQEALDARPVPDI